MTEVNAQRRLAAILAADVAGYTRLMSIDEDRTLKNWWAARKEVIDPSVEQHGGRIVKHTGDGFLTEFPTASDAVRCACDMQTQMNSRNIAEPAETRFDFRIGINLGEIIVDEEDIYGDGVNIAARLESLAPAGGICISSTVYEQVRNKPDLKFQDMGTKKVKNIDAPVHHYYIPIDNQALEQQPFLKQQVTRLKKRLTPITLILLALAIVLLALFLPDNRSSRVVQIPREKAALAIESFKFVGSHSQQESFSAGLIEDLITSLSSISGFKVIRLDADNPAGVIDRVNYIFQGSIQQVDDRVRILVQLVDSKTAFHLWGGRYDRNLTNILTIQNEVTDKIVLAVSEQILLTEDQRQKNLDSNMMTEAQGIIYQGISGLGRLAERAIMIPQKVFDWMTDSSAERPPV